MILQHYAAPLIWRVERIVSDNNLPRAGCVSALSGYSLIPLRINHSREKGCIGRFGQDVALDSQRTNGFRPLLFG